MQEAERAAIISPMLLRCWLRDDHVRDPFLRAVKYVFQLDSREEAVDQIIHFYAKMAKSTSVILSTRVSCKELAAMKAIILEGRHMYQNICESAAVAVQCEGSSRIQSRYTSPAALEASSIPN